MEPNRTAVHTETRDGVLVLRIDNPPVNALSHAVRVGLLAGLEQAGADAAVKAVVIACAGRTFVAGADITEFGQPPRDPRIATLIEAIESSRKPVVAALHGTALGGGLELALACHARIAAPTARMGLPEVKLGILPGAGGTQRLPRLVGVEKALSMIVGGEPIGAAEAQRIGLVDALAEGDLEPAAVAFALAQAGKPLVRTRDRDEALASARGKPEIFTKAREDAARRARGLEAPQRIVDAIEAAVTLPFDQGIERERELVRALMASDQSKAQRYFFFAEREAAKIPGVTPPKSSGVEQAAVIGAGTMGGGIAMNFANAGIPVTLIDAKADALERGLATIRRNYENTAKRGGLTAEQVEQRMARIRPSQSIADVAGADVVIEAVFENTALKKEVFAQIDAHAKPGAILGTNTSTLDIDDIAGATGRPQDVIGLHFFSPANVMKLLEIVRTARTSQDVVSRAMALGREIRKVPVLVGTCDGFVGNRILKTRSRQAEQVVLEGAFPQQVDKVLYDFGFPMGVYAMGDMAGLDIGWRIRQERGLKSPVGDKLCEMGRLGQKTGAGYYRYEAGSRTPIPDPVVDDIVIQASRELGIERREMPEDAILERLLFPMINESAKILEEGVALRASDIDVIWIYGYGWPIHRGGPTYYADSIGLDKVRDRLRELQQRYGDEFAPAPLLERLANEGKSFRDYQAAQLGQ